MAKSDTLKPKIPKPDRSSEIKELQEQLFSLNDLKDKILSDLRREKEKATELTKANCELKTSLEKSYLRIRELEQSMNATTNDDGIRDDYLDIVTIPPVKGYDLPTKAIKGTIVPRRIDENGFIYESLPRENAIHILSATQGPKVYLVGPVNKVTGYRKAGLYNQTVEILRHKLNKNISGLCEWIPVIVE